MTGAIERLEALERSATKGDWAITEDGGLAGGFPHDDLDDEDAGGVPMGECDIGDDDMNLIVAIRNACPALLRVARIVKAHCGSGDFDPTHPTDAAMRLALDELERVT